MIRFKNKGFTLIELLVVIAIISLLASVVLASLNSARAKARDTRRLADIKQIQTALEMYYNEYEEYPPYIDVDTTEQGANCESTLDGEFLKVLTGSYGGHNSRNIQFITRVSLPPNNNSDIISLVEGSSCGSRTTKDKYEYLVSTNRQSYVLWAYLETNCMAVQSNFSGCRSWRYEVGNACL